MEKLIYAIVLTGDNPDKLNLILLERQGITGKNLRAAPFNQISAVTGEINRNELPDNKKLIIEYAGVIEMLSNDFTLLPMRFGSIMESDELIQKMLERNHDDFLQNLIKVENKYEFGLKVLCDPEKVRTEIKVKTNINQQAQANPTQETKNTVFRDYVNKKLEEHRIEEAVLHFVDSVISEIIQYINSLNPVHKFKKMVSPTLIIDAVFLLEKQNKNGLVQAVEDFQKRYPSLNFILSGPWPPYSFTEITTK